MNGVFTQSAADQKLCVSSFSSTRDRRHGSSKRDCRRSPKYVRPGRKNIRSIHPESFLRLLEDGCAMLLQPTKNCVDFRFASDVVSEGVASVGWDTIACYTHVLRQLVVWPKGKHNSV